MEVEGEDKDKDKEESPGVMVVMEEVFKAVM